MNFIGKGDSGEDISCISYSTANPYESNSQSSSSLFMSKPGAFSAKDDLFMESSNPNKSNITGG